MTRELFEIAVLEGRKTAFYKVDENGVFREDHHWTTLCGI